MKRSRSGAAAVRNWISEWQLGSTRSYGRDAGLVVLRDLPAGGDRSQTAFEWHCQWSWNILFAVAISYDFLWGPRLSLDSSLSSWSPRLLYYRYTQALVLRLKHIWHSRCARNAWFAPRGVVCYAVKKARWSEPLESATHHGWLRRCFAAYRVVICLSVMFSNSWKTPQLPFAA
jgi:hypothetical protein